MRFAAPWLLLLLPLAALAIWQARRDARTRGIALPAPSLSLLPPARGLRPALARVASWGSLLSVALIVMAAARPQAGSQVREVVSQGIDILLAIDISGSMRSEDFRPRNRLYVAKEVAKEFVRGRREDRIGLIAFAGRSELVSPLTLDYDGLAALIDGLDFGQLPDGTAVGSAVAQAAERLRHASGKSRVVILLTEGSHTPWAFASTRSARERRGWRRIPWTIRCSDAGTSGFGRRWTSRCSAAWQGSRGRATSAQPPRSFWLTSIARSAPWNHLGWNFVRTPSGPRSALCSWRRG